jgi:hypothetical protein
MYLKKATQSNGDNHQYKSNNQIKTKFSHEEEE